ncbi:MAG: glycosyltransferase [Desulfosalsimonas sp.]
MAKSLPFVSVIIPTYHDWDRLRTCITALKAQTYPRNRFEVLIVNNDPDDEPPELELPGNFRLISESKPGSYAARNKGIRASQGEILAFTDSDCIPYPDWVEKAVHNLNAGAERIAGRVELFYNGGRLTWAEKYEKAYAFRQENKADSGTSVTANMVTWRPNFEKVGLFDDTFLSGGDLEWGFRANAAGISITYAYDSVVQHPARRRVRDLLDKRARVAAGAVRIKRPESIRGFLYWLVRGFMPPVYGYMNIRKRPDLTMNEKLCAFAVLYFIKVYSTCQKLLLMANLKKPKRV